MNNDKLDQLLRQFMDEAQRSELKEDLSYADSLFSENPAPSVDPQAVSRVQGSVRLILRRHRYVVLARQLSAIAAVVVAVLLGGLHLLYSRGPNTQSKPIVVRPEYSGSLWEDVLYTTNHNADPIASELAELTKSIYWDTSETYEATDTFSEDLMEFEEIESLTVNAAFWKGRSR